MSKLEYQTAERNRQRQEYRLNLITAQYQIAMLTGKPATIDDLATFSLQLAPQYPAAQ